MNIVFWLVIVVAHTFIWLIASFLFPLIGKYVTKLIEEVIKNIKS